MRGSIRRTNSTRIWAATGLGALGLLDWRGKKKAIAAWSISVRSKPRANVPGFLFAADAMRVTLRVRHASKNSETANRGTPSGLALPDEGRGISGDGGCPYPVASFEGGDTRLATVLRDNGTSALALDGHSFRRRELALSKN